MKDDRNGNGGREDRRSWIQRNAVFIGILSTWLMVLSGVGITTWAQSESTTALAIKTDDRSLLDHDAITTIKSDVAYIREEQKEQRTLLTEIYKIVNRDRSYTTTSQEI